MAFELTPIEILGMAGGFCSAVATLPQSLKILKTGSAPGLSVMTCIILLASYLIWLIYGYVQGSISILFWNIIATSLGLCTLYLKLKSERK